MNHSAPTFLFTVISIVLLAFMLLSTGFYVNRFLKNPQGRSLGLAFLCLVVAWIVVYVGGL